MSKRIVLGFALFASALFLAPTAHAEHFRFWIHAFIPNSGLDIVEPVPGSADRYMIPGPQFAGLGDSSCYNTNDRTFDSSLEADSKIIAEIEFDVQAPGVGNVSKTIPPLGKTIRYDCNDGTVLKTGQASNENVSLGDPSYDAGVVSFAVDGDAANPLIAAPRGWTPSIKFHATVTVDTNSKSVQFVGTIARFPAYEAYLSVDDGPPVTIFQISPDHDATAWSLIFNNSIGPSVPYATTP
jgi:hypothetical protein